MSKKCNLHLICCLKKYHLKKKIDEIKKLSPSIHEQETHLLHELPPQPSKICSSTSNTGFDSKSKYSNRIPEIDDEDFFNCPTQKVSISKKINTLKRLNQSTNKYETQLLPDQSKISSISKNINKIKKLPLTIHEQETQLLPELPPQPSKTCPSTSNTNFTSKSKHLIQVTEIDDDDDDDLFNCPTQKVSITKELNTLKKSQSNHEQETQSHLNLPPQPNKIYQSSSNNGSTSKTNDDDFNQVLKLVGDLFDSPTTPSLPENLQLSNMCKNGSNAHVTSKNKDLTLSSEIDEDFYDRPTQPHPNSLQSDNSCTNSVNSCATSVSKDLTMVSVDDADVNFLFKLTTKLLPLATDYKSQYVFNLNETKTQELSSETIIKMNSSGKKKQNKENIFGCTNQKIQTKVNQNKGNTKECALDVCGVSNVVSNHTDVDMLQISSLVRSNVINKPVTRSQNQNLFKSSITNKKQIIGVRKDLNASISIDAENIPQCIQSNQNAAIKNFKTTAKSENVSPGCPGIIPDVVNDQNVVSIKQEPLDLDEPVQHQAIYYLRHNDRSVRMNETIFSPLNEPSTSTDPLKQCQTPIAIQSNAEIPNCQPSTSNDISLQWKSFWNQKKGKSTVSTNEAIVKKERYQTRANTKRDNSQELSRKRKQDVCSEAENKRLCSVEAEDRLNQLDNKIKPPGTPDVVVTFSYLKSRNLQDMKLFIERTGGYVTDEITECTVLVTDKIRCTMKTLSALAKGCPIVEANWVKHSYTVKMFQDVDQFIISDKDAERKYKFKLKESLAKAQNRRLLEEYTVMVTPSVKPGLKDMKVIITCAGGDFVVNWPKKRRQKELIVTCDQDRRRWKSFWDNENAKIIDSNALVIAIITQNLNV